MHVAPKDKRRETLRGNDQAGFRCYRSDRWQGRDCCPARHCVYHFHSWWEMPGGPFPFLIYPKHSVCGSGEVGTCASHFDFMRWWFPRPVVSGWFIQGQKRLPWTGLARNDHVMSLEEVSESLRGGGGGGGRRESSGGGLKPFPLTLVWLALSSPPRSSCFNCSSCRTLGTYQRECQTDVGESTVWCVSTGNICV